MSFAADGDVAYGDRVFDVTATATSITSVFNDVKQTLANFTARRGGPSPSYFGFIIMTTGYFGLSD